MQPLVGRVGEHEQVELGVLAGGRRRRVAVDDAPRRAAGLARPEGVVWLGHRWSQEIDGLRRRRIGLGSQRSRDGTRPFGVIARAWPRRRRPVVGPRRSPNDRSSDRCRAARRTRRACPRLALTRPGAWPRIVSVAETTGADPQGEAGGWRCRPGSAARGATGVGCRKFGDARPTCRDGSSTSPGRCGEAWTAANHAASRRSPQADVVRSTRAEAILCPRPPLGGSSPSMLGQDQNPRRTV